MQALPQLRLVDHAYDAILTAICTHELAPGERLTQEELAERLNVSRQPIQQTLLALEKQGFLERVGRRGLRVAALDANFVRHLFQVRAALDGFAARLAAQAPTAKRSEGRRLIAAGRAAVRNGSAKERIDTDLAFHTFLYELSGNPLIRDAALLHWNHVRRAMAADLRRMGALERAWDDHEAILKAVIAGDPDEAERQARAHAESVGASLCDLLEKDEDRRSQETK